MKIGIPQALLFYRYGQLWRVFLERLGCEAVFSGGTDGNILARGIYESVGECCLPAKIFLGHVAALAGRCDHVLVPRFERLGKNDEFCVRLWGLPDVVQSTFPGISLLTYDLQGQKFKNELFGFLRLGAALGKSRSDALAAYREGKRAQEEADLKGQKEQLAVLNGDSLKVLISSQPYIAQDRFMGAPVARMLRENGAEPVFSHMCDGRVCRALSAKLSSSLYWTMNKEAIGAIELLKGRVDGVILLSCFPCGTDSFVNELVTRRVREVPLISIVLDEQMGEAGLLTRIECFTDILKERRRGHAS